MNRALVARRKAFDAVVVGVAIVMTGVVQGIQLLGLFQLPSPRFQFPSPRFQSSFLGPWLGPAFHSGPLGPPGPGWQLKSRPHCP